MFEKVRHHPTDKRLYSHGYGLPSGHVQLWDLDRKEDRVPKSWCLWTAVLEKTPESPSVCKEIKPSILREINSEYSLKGLIVRLKLRYFGHLIWTASSLDGFPDAGKDWGQEKRLSENEMVGWHHLWNRHNLDKLQEMMRDREVWCATV